MNVLILSCNIGEGHNSCAKAIKECFDTRGDKCEIVDTFSFVSPSLSKLIAKAHVFIYRYIPFIFAKGYSIAERHTELYREGTLLYKYFCSGSQKLAEVINTGEYEAVICVHPIAAVILTNAMKLCKRRFSSFCVATDYTCSPTTDESSLDTYFVPDENVKYEFLLSNIPPQKLVASGIPVRQMFYTSIDKLTAKNYEGINRDNMHLLIMCGSMGCGHIDKILDKISKELQTNEEITVVCGSNERIRHKLSRRYKNNRNIHIRGYVKDVSRLMDSADLYLTKPGGISVTEAKTKRLPMVFINAVAGCEEYNRRFFEDKGVAVSGTDIKDISKKCLRLMRDRAMITTMQERFSDFTQENSAEFICDYAQKQVEYGKPECACERIINSEMKLEIV